MMSDPKHFQEHINYQFRDYSLLEEAFLSAGASVTRPDVDGPRRGNKRLALVGDAALRLAVIDAWYKDDTDPAAGQSRFQTVGTNERLRDIAIKWELNKFVVRNPCGEKGDFPKETFAATVEAILGAVWVDSNKNLAAVQKVLNKLND